METNTITVFKGDGIGPEITDQCLQSWMRQVQIWIMRFSV